MARAPREDGQVSCLSASARVATLPDRPKKKFNQPTYQEVFERARREYPNQPFETWFGILPDEDHAPDAIISIKQIQRAVVARFPSVSRADICSARRTHEVVKPRQIAMYIAKVLTLKSLPEIGRMFGGRDHTTVLHAFRKMERLIRTHPALAQDIGEIINDLGCRDI